MEPGRKSMAINWYPGHMTIARKAAAESMRKIDLVIEMLDARIPHASCNPLFENLRRVDDIAKAPRGQRSMWCPHGEEDDAACTLGASVARK
jgi:hypothetical protein